MAPFMPWAVSAMPSTKAYYPRGNPAPHVDPSPLVGELEGEVRLLSNQWRERSVRVTLPAAIEQSLLNNPELAQAYSQIQQGQWNLIAVRRQWYPAISAFSSGPAGSLWGYRSTSTHRTISTQAGVIKNNDTANATEIVPVVNLDWSFFDPSRGAEINAASENLRSKELLFNIAARNLVLRTQLAYFNLQEQKQLIGSYEEILNATTSQVAQTEALFNAGNASLADVEQIRTQQYQTLSLLIETYLALVDASASLASAMALPPGKLVLPEDNLALYGQWDLPLDATIQQAQALREEIQSSLAEASSASWRASALFNRYLPRFSLSANSSYAYSSSENRNRLSGTLQSENSRVSRWDNAVGLGFNWKLFDGGIAAAEAEESKALERQFRDQAALQRLQVNQEVERSYASYQASRLTVLSSRSQAESARKAAISVRERFAVGYADTTSVVQTLEQATRSAIAYARSQRQYNSAVSELYRASAQWPENTTGILDQRINELKQR